MFTAHRNRIIALTIALVLMLPISVVAARWQWSRHLERDTLNALILNNAQESLSLADYSGTKLLVTDEYRKTQISGRFIASSQKLLRKQTLNGEPGYFVLTLFVTDNGKTVLVNRGWVGAVGRDVDPDVTLTPPTGSLDLTGRLRALTGEDQADPSDLPEGQTNSARTFASAVSLELIVEQLDGQEEYGLVAIPLPETQAGPHLGYVGQWILIGLTSIVVYFTVLRNLRREHLQSAN